MISLQAISYFFYLLPPSALCLLPSAFFRAIRFRGEGFHLHQEKVQRITIYSCFPLAALFIGAATNRTCFNPY